MGLDSGQVDPYGTRQHPPKEDSWGLLRQQEETERCAKVVSQFKQGQWTSWEHPEHLTLTCKDLWEMEGSQVSFICHLQCPSHTQEPKPARTDPSCSLCQTPATLRLFPHQLQNQSVPRRLHLEAQPGRELPPRPSFPQHPESQTPSPLYGQGSFQ